MTKKFLIVLCSSCNIPAQVYTSEFGTGTMLICPLCNKVHNIFAAGTMIGNGMGFVTKKYLIKEINIRV
jgi:hypothetical protein